MSKIHCNILCLLVARGIMNNLLWTFDISCIRVAYAAIVVLTVDIVEWYV
jgi:hypothetical protein